MPSVERLKERLQRTLRAKKFDAALGALTLLAKAEPFESSWPKRAASLLKYRADPRGALSAHRRALELQVEQGLALDAIASCKAILALEPEDPGALEILDLLYGEGSDGDESASSPRSSPEPSKDAGTGARSGGASDRNDAALDSIQLSDLVPGSRSVVLGEARPGQVSEIPIDDPARAEASSTLDLRLDCSATDAEKPPAPRRAAASRQKQDKKERGTASAGRGATLRSEMANIPLFGELDPESLHRLIREVRVEVLSPGQVLFRQGDPSHSLYVVVDGAVVPIAEGDRRRKLAVLERGEFFGEIGLMTRQPRNATIEALVETKLLVIDRAVVRGLIETEAKVAQTILRFLRARLVDRQIRTHLLFSAFVHAERAEVARQFRFLEVEGGTTLVEAGQAADGLYVVLSGRLVLEKTGKEIGELEPGGVFGGLSLVDGRLAPAAVVAREKCWLIVLGEGRFRRIFEANPFLDRVLRRLSGEISASASETSLIGL